MTSEKNYLFIGTAYPNKLDSFYQGLGRKNYSNVVFNQAILTELNNENKLLFVLSSVGVGHFPLQTKTLKVKEKVVSNNHVCIGYNNLIGYNVHSKYKSLLKCSRKHGIFGKDNLNILVSEASIPFLKAAKRIKENGKNNKVVLIIFDMPEHVLSDNKHSLYNLLKSRSVKQLNKLYDCVDGFIFLTNNMNSVNQKGKPFIIHPAIADMDIYKGLVAKRRETIDICYCGSISKRFDMDFLINTFKKTENSNLRLVIAGGGDGEKLVLEASKIDSRIEYLGTINRVDALKLQLSSDYLINPRLPNHDYSSYSFPSKIINYLLSMNGVISYTTDAFPKDIKDLLIIPQDLKAETLASLFDSLGKPEVKSDKVIKVLSNYSAKKFCEKTEELFNKIT